MKRRIYKTLEKVIDPVMGIDIVNLGLVYEVAIKGERDVEIVMTTATVECPLAGYLMEHTKKTLSDSIKELEQVDVKMVWSPAWSVDRMSRYAKFALEL